MPAAAVYLGDGRRITMNATTGPANVNAVAGSGGIKVMYNASTALITAPIGMTLNIKDTVNTSHAGDNITAGHANTAGSAILQINDSGTYFNTVGDGTTLAQVAQTGTVVLTNTVNAGLGGSTPATIDVAAGTFSLGVAGTTTPLTNVTSATPTIGTIRLENTSTTNLFFDSGTVARQSITTGLVANGTDSVSVTRTAGTQSFSLNSVTLNSASNFQLNSATAAVDVRSNLILAGSGTFTNNASTGTVTINSISTGGNTATIAGSNVTLVGNVTGSSPAQTSVRSAGANLILDPANAALGGNGTTNIAGKIETDTLIEFKSGTTNIGGTSPATAVGAITYANSGGIKVDSVANVNVGSFSVDNVTIQGGGNLNIRATGNSTTNNFTVSGTGSALTAIPTGATIQSGNFSMANGAALAVSGGGTFEITGSQTYAGSNAITVPNISSATPTVKFSSALTSAAGAGLTVNLNNVGSTALINNVSASPSLINMSSGTLSGSGSASSSSSVYITGAASFSVPTGSSLTLSGVISGPGGNGGDSPIKIGGGTLALNGTNLYQGNTYLQAGTTQINSSSSLGSIFQPDNSTPAATVIGNGTATSTLQATANITSSRTIALGDGNATISVDPTKTYTLNGPVGDYNDPFAPTGFAGSYSGSLNKAGTGTFVLGNTGNVWCPAATPASPPAPSKPPPPA